MPANHLVQARVDRAVKENAPLVPNEDTIEAMREARRGNLPQFSNVEDLFDDLNEDD